MEVTAPKRIRHSYTQSLVAPADKVFPLLCPVREADWVPGWNPKRVISNSGTAELDCLFVTPEQPKDSIWIISRYDPANYRLEIFKVTPDHTVGKLEVELSEAANGGTSAEVAYTYTSLGPRGDAFLEQFTEEGYRTFVERWERALNHYLLTGERLTE